MFQCPKCKDEDANLQIHHLVWHITDVGRDEDVEDSEQQDLEWCDDDTAVCTDCGWEGTVKDMTIPEPEEDSGKKPTPPYGEWCSMPDTCIQAGKCMRNPNCCD